MTVQMNTAEVAAMTSDKVGLAEGTIVLTLRGEVAVEDLQAGDKIITRDIGAQPLRAVKCHDGKSAVVAKDSLGKNSPDRDMRVAPEQAFLIRGEAPSLIRASKMAKAAVENTKLYRLVFDRAHVIYADGAELAIA
ncbi:Hint domain-containing protein [Aliiroseovarius crassostreae]|uniref:Hint domain-containing protein n=1 Tax=Aliiroseovarius crassostreae TaxID=154981 RepID=UPI003C7E02E7